MEGIEKNLHSKNRDRFTHGLSIFRREVNDVLKVISLLYGNIIYFIYVCAGCYLSLGYSLQLG